MRDGQDKKTGGKRAAWSVMDTLILILLVAAVASLIGRVVYAYRQRGTEAATAMYSVRFTVEDIHRESLENVRAFDDVYLYETGERLGNIGVYENADGTQEVAFIAVSNETGSETVFVPSSSPEEPNDTAVEETAPPVYTARTAAEGLMFCSGGQLENGCLLIEGAGLYIAPGTELTVCTERVLFTLRVTEILPQK